MPFLRLYSGPHLKEQWELGTERLTIGRAADNRIILQDPEVSKHHAYIEAGAGNSYLLVDAGSANGVFVSGKKISQHPLAFWDEIQICSYKLVFMATSRLPGEAEGQVLQEGSELDASGTVLLNPGDLAALRESLSKPQESKKAPAKPVVASISVLETNTRIPLEGTDFTFGRSRDAHLRCGGWFAPKVAATIQRRKDGDYLVPGKRGQVFVNNEPCYGPVRLHDGASFKVQGMKLKYLFPQ